MVWVWRRLWRDLDDDFVDTLIYMLYAIFWNDLLWNNCFVVSCRSSMVVSRDVACMLDVGD